MTIKSRWCGGDAGWMGVRSDRGKMSRRMSGWAMFMSGEELVLSTNPAEVKEERSVLN